MRPSVAPQMLTHTPSVCIKLKRRWGVVESPEASGCVSAAADCKLRSGADPDASTAAAAEKVAAAADLAAEWGLLL